MPISNWNWHQVEPIRTEHGADHGRHTGLWIVERVTTYREIDPETGGVCGREVTVRESGAMEHCEALAVLGVEEEEQP
jgi:hypothetical protein